MTCFRLLSAMIEPGASTGLSGDGRYMEEAMQLTERPHLNTMMNPTAKLKVP
jgi:hypothetical protein